MNPTPDATLSVNTGKVQRDEPAQRRERHHQQHQHRLPEHAELGVKQRHHQPEDESEDQPEACLRPLLVLELAAPFEAIVLRIERHLVRDGFARVGQQRGQVAAAGIELHGQVALVHPARDGAFAELRADGCDLRERHERAAARREQQAADRFRAVAGFFGEADGRVVAPLADEYLTHGAAADPGLHQVRYVGDVDAVARCRLAIDLDDELRQRRFLVDVVIDIDRAGHSLERGDHLLPDTAQLIEVLAEDSARRAGCARRRPRR